jgi:hypothetical protein
MCVKTNDGNLPNPGKLQFIPAQKSETFSNRSAGATDGSVDPAGMRRRTT